MNSEHSIPSLTHTSQLMSEKRNSTTTMTSQVDGSTTSSSDTSFHPQQLLLHTKGGGGGLDSVILQKNSLLLSSSDDNNSIPISRKSTETSYNTTCQSLDTTNHTNTTTNTNTNKNTKFASSGGSGTGGANAHMISGTDLYSITQNDMENSTSTDMNQFSSARQSIFDSELGTVGYDPFSTCRQFSDDSVRFSNSNIIAPTAAAAERGYTTTITTKTTTNTEDNDVDISDLERLGSRESSSGFEIAFSLLASKRDLMEGQEFRRRSLSPNSLSSGRNFGFGGLVGGSGSSTFKSPPHIKERDIGSSGGSGSGGKPKTPIKSFARNLGKTLSFRSKRSGSSGGSGGSGEGGGGGGGGGGTTNTITERPTDTFLLDDLSAVYESTNSAYGSSIYESSIGDGDDDVLYSVGSTDDVSLTSATPSKTNIRKSKSEFGTDSITRTTKLSKFKSSRFIMKPNRKLLQSGSKKRANRTRKTPPRNTVPIRCVGKSKHASNFRPLLLTATLTKVHDGPIWCTSFNKNGMYFATGGMDGVLQIWDVSPPKPKKKEEEETEKNDDAAAAAAAAAPPPPPVGENIENEIWKGKSHHPTTTTTTTTYPTTTSSNSSYKSINTETTTTPNTSHKSINTETTTILNAPPPTTANGQTPARGTEIILLSSTPRQRYTDHGKDIVDISWSHTDFLLSASLDKTVRLYHPSKAQCLKHFRHADIVTAVSFHPTDDRYFLTGGFDKKIRVWSIPDGRVKHWSQTPHIVTAAEYQPDGEVVVVGLFDGKVIFFHVENGGIVLKYHTQISCKNRRAKVGSKVTGLAFLHDTGKKQMEQNESPKKEKTLNRDRSLAGGVGKLLKKISSGQASDGKKNGKVFQVCVTTNDSRVRLVGLNDFKVMRKYKGVYNSSLQIKSHISESGEFIACGSETRTCTIWNNTATKKTNVTDFHGYDKVSEYETFEVTKADPYAVTDTIFVPGKSMRRGLELSGLFSGLLSPDNRHRRLHHDLSSAAIVTSDYEGTIRVFIRSSCIDDVAKMSSLS